MPPPSIEDTAPRLSIQPVERLPIEERTISRKACRVGAKRCCSCDEEYEDGKYGEAGNSGVSLDLKGNTNFKGPR